jgi:peptidoglycan/LPS O-acetylase OafA/YrhL
MLAWDATWNFLLVAIDDWPRIPKFGLRLVVFLALTFALSILSYRVIERPFLHFKDRLRPE